jgi:hypothetical protein
MKNIFPFLFFLPLAVIAQDAFSKKLVATNDAQHTEVNINNNIQGTLFTPDTLQKVPLVIIIGDSGATDRNGNERRTKSNAYLQLADSLLVRGIASYRYDKRILTQIKNQKPSDKTLFSDYIDDAKGSVDYFKDDDRFSYLYIAGHGQGSLVGMLAVDKDVDGFISLNGAGQSIDALIVQQIAQQQPGLDKVAAKTFEKVKRSEKLVYDIERDLYVLIGPQVQPFMKSWMLYDPGKEIKKLHHVRILIIHGSKNRQMAPSEASILKDAVPAASIERIDNMNHVLKTVGKDEIEASKSYINPRVPLSGKLVDIMVRFING